MPPTSSGRFTLKCDFRFPGASGNQQQRDANPAAANSAIHQGHPRNERSPGPERPGREGGLLNLDGRSTAGILPEAGVAGECNLGRRQRNRRITKTRKCETTKRAGGQDPRLSVPALPLFSFVLSCFRTFVLSYFRVFVIPPLSPSADPVDGSRPMPPDLRSLCLACPPTTSFATGRFAFSANTPAEGNAIYVRHQRVPSSAPSAARKSPRSSASRRPPPSRC